MSDGRDKAGDGGAVALRSLPAARVAQFWYRPLVAELIRQGVEAEDYQRLGPVRTAARLVANRRVTRRVLGGPGSGPGAGERAYICMAGRFASTGSFFPVGLRSEVIPYGMDCWEPTWDAWAGMLRRHKVRVACVSARRSAEALSERVPGARVLWVPEAVEPAEYRRGGPLAERPIDLLEMGRQYPAFSDPASEGADRFGYVFRRPEGEGASASGPRAWGGRRPVFETRAELVEGLASSKLLVCYPRCDTHPDLAGSVETVTLRYFEGMASGCVVVGRAPAELVDLFGYNPVVEVEACPEAGRRVSELLGRLDELQALVDRNARRLEEVATWRVRVREMLAMLGREGYAAGG